MNQNLAGTQFYLQSFHSSTLEKYVMADSGIKLLLLAATLSFRIMSIPCVIES